MQQRTAEEFKKQAELKGITEWHMRDCSLCGYPLKYLFDGDKVEYDSGCDCTRSSTILPRTWNDIARHYNIQDNPEYIATMDKFWGFEVDEPIKT